MNNIKASRIKASRSALVTILLTVFLDLVGFSIIFPLFPDMLDHYLSKEDAGGWLHGFIATVEQFSGMQGDKSRLATTVLFGGILGSLYSLLQFVAAPIWGALSDRHGRRKILIFTVGGTVISYLMWVTADWFWLLVASRFVGGMMAGNLSVATAAVADVTDKSNRAKGMGMIGAAFGVGFVVGPTLGAFLSGWDATTTLSFIPGVNPFSVPALVALVLAVVNFVLVLKRFPETRTQQAETAHAKRPLNPLTLFRPSNIPGVNLTNMLYFVFIAAFAGMEFTLTFLAKDRFGYTARDQGFIFLFIGIIIVIVQGGLVRRLAPKYGERKLVLAGLTSVVPGLYLVGICQQQWLLYAGLFLLAAGSSLATPSLTSLISLYTPEQRQGESLGIFRSIGSLGRAIAPLIAAAVYWRFGSEWPYFGAALILLVPIALAFRLPAPSLKDVSNS